MEEGLQDCPPGQGSEGRPCRRHARNGCSGRRRRPGRGRHAPPSSSSPTSSSPPCTNGTRPSLPVRWSTTRTMERAKKRVKKKKEGRKLEIRHCKIVVVVIVQNQIFYLTTLRRTTRTNDVDRVVVLLLTVFISSFHFQTMIWKL